MSAGPGGFVMRFSGSSNAPRSSPYPGSKFLGPDVRSELTEIQKASMGRKYARVDRRPLDPPPVVSMRMYSATGPQGMLVSPEDVLTLGLVCTVDLFPVPPISEALVPFQSPALTTEPSAPFHYVDGQPIYEHTKVTSAIVGSTIVQPNTIDWKNELQLMFVFSDLSVRCEGLYFLRYRVFDLFNASSSQIPLPMQNECYGAPFRVYSTKDFPGLGSSSELTKHLSKSGVRLSIRAPDRKRRKKQDGSDSDE